MLGRGSEKVTTLENLEMVMATNYLGHFLLTTLLVPTLRKTRGEEMTRNDSKIFS